MILDRKSAKGSGGDLKIWHGARAEGVREAIDRCIVLGISRRRVSLMGRDPGHLA